jgi:hypothetical protein
VHVFVLHKNIVHYTQFKYSQGTIIFKRASPNTAPGSVGVYTCSRQQNSHRGSSASEPIQTAQRSLNRTVTVYQASEHQTREREFITRRVVVLASMLQIPVVTMPHSRFFNRSLVADSRPESRRADSLNKNPVVGYQIRVLPQTLNRSLIADSQPESHSRPQHKNLITELHKCKHYMHSTVAHMHNTKQNLRVINYKNFILDSKH